MQNQGQWVTYLYFDMQMIPKFGYFWNFFLDNDRIDGLYSYYLHHGELPEHDFCQSDGCENLGQVAHHTSYDNLDADFDAELNDLQWLCFGCHSKIHGK